jgi:ABC-type xylose transport system permease subunit
MKSLEDKLRPRGETNGSLLRDGLVWAMLGALFLAMLPVWWMDRMLLASLAGGDTSHLGDVIEHISRLLLSYWLLPALGFMLALRCGAIDLSVWTTAGLAGVVSAAILQDGGESTPTVAITAGIAVGAACGAVNGALVAGLRIPCPIVSLVMAFGLIGVLGEVVPGREIILNDGDTDGLLSGFQGVADWSGLPEFTRQSIAAFMMFIIYAITMAAAVVYNKDTGTPSIEPQFSERWRLFASLTASGALSAAGGVLWLVEHGVAPVPGRPFDDLVVPAAALLAGGLYLAGPGRTLLACVLLPGALAMVIGWRQEVMELRSDYLLGYPLQVAMLIAMIGLSRFAMTRAAAPEKLCAMPMALAWLSSLGIAVFAASVWCESPQTRMTFHIAGASIWLIGGLGAIALKLASRRCLVELVEPELLA